MVEDDLLQQVERQHRRDHGIDETLESALEEVCRHSSVQTQRGKQARDPEECRHAEQVNGRHQPIERHIVGQIVNDSPSNTAHVGRIQNRAHEHEHCASGIQVGYV